MIFSVDRIKDGVLICEDIESGDLQIVKPKEKIPEIKEGSIIEVKDGKIILKEKIYLKRKEKILNLRNKLCESDIIKE
ncbi:MAG: DUF3006 family protein [Clostridia bacterium]|nr:DUF3006 family protein [Clostridia bacterium]